MSETTNYPKARAKLTRDALSIDLMGIVGTMTPEDRLDFCRAVAFEERIFTGLCDAIVSRHGWLWPDSDEAWGWGKHHADELREKLIPLMPEAAVHLIANAKDDAARANEDLERERRYALSLQHALDELQQDVPWSERVRVERPERPRTDLSEAMNRARRHEDEAREAVAP